MAVGAAWLFSGDATESVNQLDPNQLAKPVNVARELARKEGSVARAYAMRAEDEASSGAVGAGQKRTGALEQRPGPGSPLGVSTLPSRSSFGGAIIQPIKVESTSGRIILAAVAQMTAEGLAAGSASSTLPGEVSPMARTLAASLAEEPGSRAVVLAVRRPNRVSSLQLFDESGRPFLPAGAKLVTVGNVAKVIFPKGSAHPAATYGRMTLVAPQARGGDWFRVSGGAVVPLRGSSKVRLAALDGGAVKLSLPKMMRDDFLQATQVLSADGLELPVRRRWQEGGAGWIMLGKTTWARTAHIRIPVLAETTVYTGLLNLKPRLQTWRRQSLAFAGPVSGSLVKL